MGVRYSPQGEKMSDERLQIAQLFDNAGATVQGVLEKMMDLEDVLKFERFPKPWELWLREKSCTMIIMRVMTLDMPFFFCAVIRKEKRHLSFRRLEHPSGSWNLGKPSHLRQLSLSHLSQHLTSRGNWTIFGQFPTFRLLYLLLYTFSLFLVFVN
jgi:hypothetical protein